MRTIQSKATRIALWEYGGGQCQRCGMEVGADFEVDHIIPVSRGGDSGMSNLQILCRKCNRRKSDKMITLRSHQQEARQLAEAIRAGLYPELDRILAVVTPGGGKSSLPVIFGSALMGNTIDKIVWIVPRTSLQEQSEEAFTDGEFRALLGHTLKIRTATNEIDPARGLSGYVTTYQAIASAPQFNLQQFSQYGRVLLVLDEFHHVDEDSSTWAAIAPLMAHAKLTLLMTGTLERGDKGFIGPLEYQNVAGKKWTPILDESSGTVKIMQYPRRQGLLEEAILQMDFEHCDGAAIYTDRKGQRQVVDSIAELDDPSAAIFAALDSEYAYRLLDKAAAHWKAYKSKHPRSKMLVVAPRARQAREYAKYLTDKLGIDKVGVALAQDGALGDAVIDGFREKGKNKKQLYDVLVTVGKAYEGLDVPSCTHIACLTHIRSTPWILQMLARAMRYDRKAGPYRTQRCFCFAPDDVYFHEAIRQIREDQEAVALMREEGPPGPGGPSTDIIPETSDLTRTRGQALNETSLYLDYEVTESLQTSMERNGVEGVSTMQMWAVMEEYRQQGGNAKSGGSARPAPDITPSAEEAALRDGIEQHNRTWEGEHKVDFGTINTAIKIKFGKGRPEMTLVELRQVWAWVQQTYPIQSSGVRL